MTALLHQPRHAAALASWGLGRRDDRWWHHAVCVATPELHTGDMKAGWQKPGSVQGHARHVCRAHCPVLEQCRREALRRRPADVVQGGAVWTNTSRGPAEARQQPDDPRAAARGVRT